MGWFDWFRGKKSSDAVWRIGQRVLGQCVAEGMLFPGTIFDYDKSRYHVHFDNGQKAWLKTEKITELDLKIGSQVFARRQGGEVFFAGTIVGQNGERIHIRYQDGDKEWTRIGMVAVHPHFSVFARQANETMTTGLDAVEKALGAGEYAAAAEFLDSMIRVFPSAAVLHLQRGKAKFNLNKHEDAVTDCSRALELGLDDVMRGEALYHLGSAYAALGRHELAETELERAVSFAPSKSEYHKALGDTSEARGCILAALASYEHSLELDPENFLARLRRGSVYSKLERYADAIADMSAYLQIVPHSAVAVALRAIAYGRLGDAEHGIPELTRAIAAWQEQKSEPAPAQCHWLRGKLFQQQGRLPEALADFDVVMALKPKEEFQVGTDRAEILLALGQPEAAEKALQEGDRWARHRIQEVQQRGVYVMAALVMANAALYDPGSTAHSFCRVLITFDPELGRDHKRLLELASWLISFKNTEQTDPQMQYVAELTTVEKADATVRRRLPADATGGKVVYVTDLHVYRRFWPVLNAKLLPCVAEPGDVGRQELLPPD